MRDLLHMNSLKHTAFICNNTLSRWWSLEVLEARPDRTAAIRTRPSASQETASETGLGAGPILE